MIDLISPNFTFSQSNLQTFSYCRRRFYLRYVRKLIWPAQLVNDQQFAQDKDAGVRFHRIVHQYFLGFDQALLRKVAEADPDTRMVTWLEAFFDSQMSRLEGDLFPEALYTISVAGRSLSAKVDLLQIENGSIKIFDWKTSRLLPKLTSLQKQAQSKVYPLVVSRIFDGQKPQNLKMVYWEANFPEQTIEINSSQPDWHHYELEITDTIKLILSLTGDEFVPTPDERKCTWCEYRSYCKRGKATQKTEVLEEIGLIHDEIFVPEDVFDSQG